MLENLFEDVLARGAAGRAAGDDALQALEARARLVLDRLACNQRGAEPLNDRLRLRQPLAQLGGAGLLGQASCIQALAQFRHRRGLAVSPPHEVPGEERYGNDPGQHTYK